MKKLLLILFALSVFLFDCVAQSNETLTYSIFSGKVISISESHQKEGTFAEVKVKVDSIIQMDTITNELPGYHNYLNKKRVQKHNNKKPLIVTILVEPELCYLQVSMRYIVYTQCCNVDSYYYDIKRTKRLVD
jgi:hypothetical protein